MPRINKDNNVNINIRKNRKKSTIVNFDTTEDRIIINFDIVSVSQQDEEISKNGTGQTIIDSSRFNEPLVAAFIQAANNLINNEM